QRSRAARLYVRLRETQPFPNFHRSRLCIILTYDGRARPRLRSCLVCAEGRAAMSLAEIMPLLERDEWVIALRDAVEGLPNSRVLEVDDLPVAARAAVLATIISSSQRPTVIVTSRLDSAEEIAGLLAEYLGIEPLVWPVAEALPYEQLPVDRSTSARRVETLVRLLDGDASVIVAPARALAQIVNPPDQLARERLEITVG